MKFHKAAIWLGLTGIAQGGTIFLASGGGGLLSATNNQFYGDFHYNDNATTASGNLTRDGINVSGSADLTAGTIVGIVAMSGLFDLDHLRAQLPKPQSGVGPGQNPCEVQHTHAVQRATGKGGILFSAGHGNSA